MPDAIKITSVLIAVVQSQDADRAHKVAEEITPCVSRLASIGGFLRKRNVSLLIGVPEGKWDRLKVALEETCHQRVEYISVPLEGVPLPVPTPTPITIGGASMFGFEIEHFEEI